MVGVSTSTDNKSHKAALKVLELRQETAAADQADVELQLARMGMREQKRLERRHQHTEIMQGVFHLRGVVDSDKCAVLEMAIRLHCQLNADAPITLQINTPGGDVIAGLGLYDTLRTIAGQGHHITTVVRGYAASMGAVLFQAGDLRLIGAESEIMLHELSAGSYGKASSIKDDSEFYDRLNSKLFDILARKAKVKKKVLVDRTERRDAWLDAKTAVELGLADRIG